VGDFGPPPHFLSDHPSNHPPYPNNDDDTGGKTTDAIDAIDAIDAMRSRTSTKTIDRSGNRSIAIGIGGAGSVEVGRRVRMCIQYRYIPIDQSATRINHPKNKSSRHVIIIQWMTTTTRARGRRVRRRTDLVKSLFDGRIDDGFRL